MSVILKFRMLSDENDNFLRDYEVPSNMTLLDLHNYICRSLEYDANNITSFFTSNKLWEKLQEFTLMDMGAEPYDDPEQNAALLMEDVTLADAMEHSNRLIYHFDMIGDRALYLELLESYEEEGEDSRPRLTKTEESAPDQFIAADSLGDRESIFDEVMSDFDDFEGDEEYDDGY